MGASRRVGKCVPKYELSCEQERIRCDVRDVQLCEQLRCTPLETLDLITTHYGLLQPIVSANNALYAVVREYTQKRPSSGNVTRVNVHLHLLCLCCVRRSVCSPMLINADI